MEGMRMIEKMLGRS